MTSVSFAHFRRRPERGALALAQALGEDLENVAADGGAYCWVAGTATNHVGPDDVAADGYMPRRVVHMRIDAECLLALVARRPVFVGCGSAVAGDTWVDPYGMYHTIARPARRGRHLARKGLS
jgi:hypothetical protein